MEQLKQAPSDLPKRLDVFAKAVQIENVDLDWRAYFISFCEAHGSPVQYGGRLLFPDGWTYSATDYHGPEWPPPTNKKELQDIKRQYKLIRRAGLKVAIHRLETQLESLRRMQEVRPVPLMARGLVEDSETGNVAIRSMPIDFQALEIRLELLKTEFESLPQQADVDPDLLCSLCELSTEDVKDFGCPVCLGLDCPNAY